MEKDVAQERLGGLSLLGAVPVWLRIGLLSFGGPAAQIALMHRVLVDEKRWLGERQFLSALNFCMLLPGPEAMQLATYAGWRMHGVAGGLVAGLLFVLPGAILMLALAAIYAAYGSLPALEVLFLGIKAAVLAIVLQALLRVAGRALNGPLHWLLAAASFLALFIFHIPFPIVVLASALIGAALPSFFATEIGGSQPSVAATEGAAPPDRAVGGSRSWAGTLRTIALWAAIWLGPLALLWAILGGDHVLVRIGWFFSKLAVVTFGGAYAVLAYMAQEVVESYGWLTAGEMLDGLGLAETTLGPLILVTEFVGFLAAFREASGENAWLMACAGAIVTLWATFAPCFLWIFAGAPYVEWLQTVRPLRAALSAVTAAVVGVILNLSLWFGLKVVFSVFHDFQWGPAAVELPVLSSFDAKAALLSVIAAVALFGFRAGVIGALAVTGGAAIAFHVAGWQ